MNMIKPENEAALAECIASANGPLRIIGGGTRPIGDPVEGEVLSASGMSGVTLYEPGALTIVAKAGTPVSEIEDTLAAEGQRLAFEPMDHRALLGTSGTPTIGGAVAGNVSGPRRIQVGACRDSLLGVRFVDGMGRVLKNGGRVMKNVTGYDLVKLMAGSRGTLGVLTEVSLKVQAIPETEATLVAPELDLGNAISALSKALGSPFDLTGAGIGADGRAMIRLEGLARSVSYRVQQLQSSICDGWQLVEGEQSAMLWKALKNLDAFSGQDGFVWRVSVKPSDGPEVIQALGAPRSIFDWGGGLISIATDDPDLPVRDVVASLGGHATLVRSVGQSQHKPPAFHPEPAPLALLSQGIRDKFDPRGILNPGLMG
ncbi:FAD-binding protein [Pelagimonas sp. KU-00592-HH]